VEIIRQYGSVILDDTRTIPYPKIPPSEAVNAYGSSSIVQPSSLDVPLVTVLDITKEREKLYLHTVR
jgi:hypothetical protein